LRRKKHFDCSKQTIAEVLSPQHDKRWSPFQGSWHYHNPALRKGMQAAEIFKRSCFIKGESELVFGVERRGMKSAIH
jgi:hypothetical protein